MALSWTIAGILKDVAGNIYLPIKKDRRDVSSIQTLARETFVEVSPVGLGTKNRQKQTAEICKQHLREKYREKLGLLEEFILEIEGTRKNYDVARWGQFTDIKDNKEEMLRRVDVHFENWLNA